MIVYSAQGINDPVTSAMHIIFGECSFITSNLDQRSLENGPLAIMFAI